MRTLFWKLFGAFWVTTVIILAISIFASFRLADEQSINTFPDPREIDAVLQQILQTQGIGELESYVKNADHFPPGQTVYLIDETGLDLLDRTVPGRVQVRARHIWSIIREHGQRHRNGERRPPRLRQSLLETADGTLLLAMPGPTPPPRFGFFSSGSGRWTVLSVAAAISLLVFWLLSRSLTRPVIRISETAAQLANGDMKARVGAGAYTRDEIGQLATQFDRMAAELEKQTSTRRELFRNIAHELRAPLTRLQIALELLNRNPERAAEQFDRIQYEITRVENLASQVLALARAEQKQGSNEVTSLTQVVDQIVADAQFEAAASNVNLSYNGPDTTLQVKGNADSIASAIENVVRNAVQHTPSGGHVSLVVTDAPYCSVVVSDTGPGVPEPALEKIYEPFYRQDTNRPGAGIGLAITQRVLHQVGGELLAANRPGGGLEITMRFVRNI